MELKKGDRFFSTKTGESFMIEKVGDYFFLWRAEFRGEWIPVAYPVRILDLKIMLSNREILEDTPSNRILYGI